MRTYKINFKIYLPVFLLYSFFVGTVKYPASILKGFAIESIYLSMRFSLPLKWTNDPIKLAIIKFIVELVVNCIVEIDNKINWYVHKI